MPPRVGRTTSTRGVLSSCASSAGASFAAGSALAPRVVSPPLTSQYEPPASARTGTSTVMPSQRGDRHRPGIRRPSRGFSIELLDTRLVLPPASPAAVTLHQEPEPV